MTAKKCAFLTMADRGDHVTDYDVCHAAMANLSWDVGAVDWRDKSIDWDDYDAVYIWMPWDYPQHLDEFVRVLQDIENSKAVLVNPLALVHWTLAKSYLRDLEQQGVGIIPSIWCKDIDASQIPSWFACLRTDKLVIKPEVGASALDTHVLNNPPTAEMISLLEKTYYERAFLVQPFMENIQSEGEFSLFYFSGEFSHAILKVPKDGDFRVQEEYGGDIQSVQPSAQLIESGQQVLSLIDPQPVYARIDFVRAADGQFLIIELELIEPSLYLRTNDQAAARFAAAFDQYVLGVKA